eukprot:TRINITY_DN71265_c0_g1_i1.p1 TRINITY_DN71265_c0_g1~~TRINITY_DN71265_c0_g1_i1.p1  ORF type:complete len:626 (+),score=115.73 TRINITY_DN71265_c0_g1_i1:86-1879(+)
MARPNRADGREHGRSPTPRSVPRSRSHRRTALHMSRSPRRSRSRRRRRRSGSRGRGRGRSDSVPTDTRREVEKDKGGVKLFVGRLPREVSQRRLKECFEEFGEVLEIFVIDSKAVSNVGCAFVRMTGFKEAEAAIRELHEQRVLIPEQRELGPMQVAFAKGEAIRLGLDEREETLPSFKEAKLKVVEHKEKRKFFEVMQRQTEKHQQVLLLHQNFHREVTTRAARMPLQELVALVKDGQRSSGNHFKKRWWAYCDQGWANTKDRDPARHSQESLLQFIGSVAFNFHCEPWFKKRIGDLSKPPPALPPPPLGMLRSPTGVSPASMPGMPPPLSMPGPPPGMLPPPGIMAPCGMPPPPLGSALPRMVRPPEPTYPGPFPLPHGACPLPLGLPPLPLGMPPPPGFGIPLPPMAPVIRSPKYSSRRRSRGDKPRWSRGWTGFGKENARQRYVKNGVKSEASPSSSSSAETSTDDSLEEDESETSEDTSESQDEALGRGDQAVQSVKMEDDHSLCGATPQGCDLADKGTASGGPPVLLVPRQLQDYTDVDGLSMGGDSGRSSDEDVTDAGVASQRHHTAAAVVRKRGCGPITAFDWCEEEKD